MLIAALLAALGIDLITLAAFILLVLGRRRWVKRQPGEFSGAVRVTAGDVDGLKSRWKRGSGRWVRDVFVWSKGPLMFSNELVPVDRCLGEQPAHATEVKRLGDAPVVIGLASDGATIEIAAKAEDRALVISPFARCAVAQFEGTSTNFEE